VAGNIPLLTVSGSEGHYGGRPEEGGGHVESQGKRRTHFKEGGLGVFTSTTPAAISGAGVKKHGQGIKILYSLLIESFLGLSATSRWSVCAHQQSVEGDEG